MQYKPVLLLSLHKLLTAGSPSRAPSLPSPELDPEPDILTASPPLKAWPGFPRSSTGAARQSSGGTGPGRHFQLSSWCLDLVMVWARPAEVAACRKAASTVSGGGTSSGWCQVHCTAHLAGIIEHEAGLNLGEGSSTIIVCTNYCNSRSDGCISKKHRK